MQANLNVDESIRKPVIAVDIDEVLALFIPTLALYYNERYQTSYTADHFVSMDFDKVWGKSKEETAAIMDDFILSPYFSDISRIKPVPVRLYIVITLPTPPPHSLPIFLGSFGRNNEAERPF
jgi:hypothetical protein